MIRRLVQMSAVLVALLAGVPAVAAPLMDSEVTIRLHDKAAGRVLNEALTGASYWSDASTSTSNNKTFDEIRLKNVDAGYVAMISGEGNQDFAPEVVSDIIFSQQHRLPRYTSGAKAIVPLGRGYDPVVGANYVDSFFFLDFSLFYGTYVQRLYRTTDAAGRTVLWFEKVTESVVGTQKWSQYQEKIEKAKADVSTRWALGKVIEVSTIYGMFVVTPGTERQTRVTFVTRILFDSDAGFIASVGSRMPPVIKAGLKSGFEASVQVASDEQERRVKAAQESAAGG